MPKSFARIRLNMLLKSQAFGAVGALVWSVADMIVSGNMVGVDALAGIAATVPVTIGAQFFARLVYCGSGYVFARCQGAFDHEGAKKAVGLSLELAVAMGLFTYAVMFFGRDLYLDFVGISGGAREQAVAYWRWMSVFCALNPFTMTMWRLVYADGEVVTTAAGDLLAPFLTVGLSILFTKMTGSAAGAALGTLVAGVLSDSTMMTHVFRKTNQIVPKWNFSWSGARELVTYSLTDSSTKFCQCAFMTVVNKLVILSSSAAYLPVVSVIALVLELRALLDRIGDAYMPIAEMYLGEKNVPRVRELCRYSFVVALVAGFAFAAVVATGAPQIVALYGIPSAGADPAPDVYRHAVTALQISALMLPLSSLLSFICSHYLVIGRVGLSVIDTVLAEFVLTASCAAAFCLIWGLDALWVGLPFGALVTLLATILYGRFCDTSRSAMLIPESRTPVLNLSFEPSAEMAVEVRDDAEHFLRRHGVGEQVLGRIMLLVEECAMSVADGNKASRRAVTVEISFVVDGGEVRMVIRDTGRTKDVTDRDAQVSNLRSFVLAGLMSSYEDRRYLNTIGCNRAAFVFPK